MQQHLSADKIFQTIQALPNSDEIDCSPNSEQQQTVPKSGPSLRETYISWQLVTKESLKYLLSY